MSDMAFASATVFSMKRLFVAESEQQGLVNIVMLLMDLGLGIVLVVLAIFLIWRLYDLFRAKGYWNEEFTAEKRSNAEAEIKEQKQKIEELEATLKEVSK